ncbi:hypothetical protein D5086_008164 [Populus alba]|uniref:Uncharacterized protein n=1 Tax=Populus alba TaxID=43335 RepID=A0ACC4CG04_POPAL
MSEWWSVADWRMSNSWSFVKGSRILRISSGVRGVIGDGGEVPVGIEMPFSSALRFLMNSMVAEAVVVDCLEPVRVSLSPPRCFDLNLGLVILNEFLLGWADVRGLSLAILACSHLNQFCFAGVDSLV